MSGLHELVNGKRVGSPQKCSHEIEVFAFRTMLWWQTNLRAGAPAKATMLPVTVRREETILLRIRGAEVVVTDGTPSRRLRKVVDALGSAS